MRASNQDPQETSRTATTAGKERNMSLIWRIGTSRTLSFAVGVTLGLVSAAPAQSGAGAQLPAQPPDPPDALCQWPIVAGYGQQPSAEETDRRRDERGTAPSMRRFRDEPREVHHQLYEQIVRQADTAIRP
jgi:hypothetical protein